MLAAAENAAKGSSFVCVYIGLISMCIYISFVCMCIGLFCIHEHMG